MGPTYKYRNTANERGNLENIIKYPKIKAREGVKRLNICKK
jgi:hypothetical protein